MMAAVTIKRSLESINDFDTSNSKTSLPDTVRQVDKEQNFYMINDQTSCPVEFKVVVE